MPITPVQREYDYWEYTDHKGTVWALRLRGNDEWLTDAGFTTKTDGTKPEINRRNCRMAHLEFVSTANEVSRISSPVATDAAMTTLSGSGTTIATNAYKVASTRGDRVKYPIASAPAGP